ncbi:hypothetical protein CP082626L3_1091B, partial [Chlamydia psittaci 08-2626_L3]
CRLLKPGYLFFDHRKPNSEMFQYSFSKGLSLSTRSRQ